MSVRKDLVVSLVLVAVLWHAVPSDPCVKKWKVLLRGRSNFSSFNGSINGTEEKPAELVTDESAYIRDSHASRDSMYIEVGIDENSEITVREVDGPPVAMSQMSEMNETEKSIAGNDTSKEKVSVTSGATTEAKKDRGGKAVGSEGGVEEEEEEEILTLEDEAVRMEWKGKCLASDWARCNQIRRIEAIDVIHTKFQRKSLKLNCLTEKILCLKNGWTANRCHILCMAKCNRDLFFQWDEIVDFEGPCRYR